MPEFKDYSGSKIGMLTVKSFSHRSEVKTAYWNCVCECGNEKVINGNALAKATRLNKNLSCGCARKPKDITNQKFGTLTAIRHVGTKSKRSTWECLCECGSLKEYSLYDLLKNKTKSCGCKRNELIKESHKNRNYDYLVKHGHSRNNQLSETYGIWAGIRTRCVNPNDTAYHNYGGRGITICERWIDSFENFLEDMGERPGKEYSIDRIDNEQGYSPENCKWTTRKEQHRNTRRNVWLEYNGVKKVMADWADEYGIKRQTLKHRLFVQGWDMEKALTTPSRKSKKQ